MKTKGNLSHRSGRRAKTSQSIALQFNKKVLDHAI